MPDAPTGPPSPEAIATTERLKDRIRACVTLAEVSRAVAEIAVDAKAHEPNDPGGIAQLRNLISWQRQAIDNGWVGQKSETPDEPAILHDGPVVAGAERQ